MVCGIGLPCNSLLVFGDNAVALASLVLLVIITCSFVERTNPRPRLSTRTVYKGDSLSVPLLETTAIPGC